jgi:hypothetical protein
MSAAALDLNLTITHTYFITRCPGGSRTGEDTPIAHTETGTMPGAFDNIAHQLALIEWAACMGTGSRDGKEL